MSRAGHVVTFVAEVLRAWLNWFVLPRARERRRTVGASSGTLEVGRLEDTEKISYKYVVSMNAVCAPQIQTPRNLFLPHLRRLVLKLTFVIFRVNDDMFLVLQ